MPARWLVLTVRVPSEELTEELAGGLVALGGTAVMEEDDRLTTYLPAPADVDGFRTAARDRLSAIVGGEPDVCWRWQDHEDWSRRWRQGLEPRRVGRRIVVTQPWNPVDPEPDDVVVVVDPATAFGTGEHATTRGALRLMEPVIAGGERVLDVGTGSGILAIAAVGLGAAGVVAAEADGNAIGNARENLDRNAVSDRVELVNDGVDSTYLAAVRGTGFDLIVANVLSGVLVPLLPAFREALAEAGRLVLSGILTTEAADVMASAGVAGLALEAEDHDGDWWSGRFRRRPAG